MLWFIHHCGCTAAWLLQPCAGHKGKERGGVLRGGSAWPKSPGSDFEHKPSKAPTLTLTVYTSELPPVIIYLYDWRNSFSSYIRSFVCFLQIFDSVFDLKTDFGWHYTSLVNQNIVWFQGIRDSVSFVNTLPERHMTCTHNFSYLADFYCRRQACFPG